MPVLLLTTPRRIGAVLSSALLERTPSNLYPSVSTGRTAMQKRRLGKTELEVTCVGLAGIPIARATMPEAERVVRKAVEAGINYFETAWGYKGSEERMGQFLRKVRDKVIIASQAGTRTAEITKNIDESLQRLGTDYIDIYKFHGLSSIEDLEKVLAPGGALEGLMKARDQGKIRFFGVSGHWPAVQAELIRRCPQISVAFIFFNFMTLEPIEVLFPLAREHDVGVVVMKALGGGYFRHPEIALRWVLEYEEVSTIALGMWTEYEVEIARVIASNPSPLEPAERRWLEAEYARLDKLYCRHCYKHTCPKKINISVLMSTDMFYLRHGPEELASRWKLHEQLAKVEECDDCGECIRSCPYALPIPTLLRQAYERYTRLVESYAEDQSTSS